MNPRTLAVALVVALVLAGCKTVTVQGDYDFAANPGKGLVAFSTRMNEDTSCPNSLMMGTLGFRGEAKEASVVFDMRAPRPERKESTYSDMGGTQEVTIPAEPPTLFTVQEVPAGRYVLNSLEVVNHCYPLPYKHKHFPGISFTVPEGQVVYVGELEVKTTWKNYVSAMYFTVDFEFWVRDEWERDRALFQARIPNIRPEVVRTRLLEKP